MAWNAMSTGVLCMSYFLVSAGQTYPLLKLVLGPTWGVLARWEEIRPVRHHFLRSCFGPCLCGYLYGPAALVSDEGIVRIGEVL